MKNYLVFMLIIIMISCVESDNGDGDIMDIQIGESWSVLQGENNGMPMIIRRNNCVRRYKVILIGPFVQELHLALL
jgi:hypothetical protein